MEQQHIKHPVRVLEFGHKFTLGSSCICVCVCGFMDRDICVCVFIQPNNK